MTYIHNIKPELVAPLTNLLHELKQTVGVLCTVENDGSHCYCFEGALCELYRRMTGDGEWTRDALGSYRMEFKCNFDDPSFFACPGTVTQWATVDAGWPLADVKKTIWFSDLNDDGSTFEDMIIILHTKADAE